MSGTPSIFMSVYKPDQLIIYLFAGIGSSAVLYTIGSAAARSIRVKRRQFISFMTYFLFYSIFEAGIQSLEPFIYYTYILNGFSISTITQLVASQYFFRESRTNLLE